MPRRPAPPATRPPDEFYILVNEEFGFALWFWVPEMTAAEVEAWWLAVEAAREGESPLFFNTKNLPGRRIRADWDTWQRLYKAGGLYHAHAHWEDDSYLARPDGTVILHRGHPDGPRVRRPVRPYADEE